MTERTRETRDVQLEKSRPRRVPIHEQKRDVLTIKNKDPNYVYRVVNDKSNRVSQYKAAGYVVEESSNVEVGEAGVVDRNVSLGSGAQISVGQGVRAVLMKQRKEDYEADQKAKQRDIDRKEKLLMRKKVKSTESGEDGTYGEVSLSRD